MTIEILEGYELTSVIFIRDYTQFVFEGEKVDAILSAFTLPTTMVNNRKYSPQTRGWRDALCLFINKTVKTALAEEGNAIKITFEDGDMLEVSLREADYEERAEAAMLSSEGVLAVW